MHQHSHLYIVLAVAGFVLFMVWHTRRLRTMLRAWADGNGFKLLEYRGSWSGLPPVGMLFTTSKYQTLLHVKVYDLSTHRIRTGWLKLGGYWVGLWDADAVEVRWDET